MNVPPQQNKLRVHYFYIRGQCQPIRNLLYYLDIDFEDIMHQQTPQNTVDAAFHYGFPMLEDGELKIHDAIAIMNYVCRKYNRLDLLGLTPQSFAKVQQVLIRFSMQKKKIVANIYDMIKYLSITNQAERQKIIRQKLKKLTYECKFVDHCLKKTTLNKSFVCKNLTIIDFLYYETCFYLQGFFNDEIKRHSYFKNFIQFKQNFQKQPFFHKNRPKFEQKYVFFEFDDMEMNKKIEKFWKGSSKCLKQVVK